MLKIKIKDDVIQFSVDKKDFAFSFQNKAGADAIQ